MTVHWVHELPAGGEYTRAGCGFVTKDPARLNTSINRPDDGCRKCWHDVEQVSDRTKLKQIELVLDGPELDREAIRAILQGRYRESNRSPKAA